MQRHSKEYIEYLRSPLWRLKRQEAIEWAQNKCTVCGSQRRLQVHHLTYERLGKEHLFDLQVVCKECHKEADKARPSLVSMWCPRCDHTWKSYGDTDDYWLNCVECGSEYAAPIDWYTEEA